VQYSVNILAKVKIDCATISTANSRVSPWQMTGDFPPGCGVKKWNIWVLTCTRAPTPLTDRNQMKRSWKVIEFIEHFVSENGATMRITKNHMWVASHNPISRHHNARRNSKPKRQTRVHSRH
jgi:hypothetical protein